MIMNYKFQKSNNTKKNSLTVGFKHLKLYYNAYK